MNTNLFWTAVPPGTAGYFPHPSRKLKDECRISNDEGRRLFAQNLLNCPAVEKYGKLTLVPTPVGNLQDITFRAVEALRAADAVLCEDTRVSGRLLKHFDIQKSLESFHAHNEHRRLEKVMQKLKSGLHLALVTDAGTPGISDPGFLLVRECLREGISVECLPGPTAFVPALVLSGLPSDRFHFEGFLPPKKGRQKRLSYLASLEVTFILYESPHRLLKTLEQLADHCDPDRPASVSREISKLHEETIRGSLRQLQEHFQAHPPRGEIVLVVGAAP